MILNKKQLELGFCGLALLRNRLVGRDYLVRKISNEMKLLNDIQSNGKKDESKEVIKKYSVKSGYKIWYLDYDKMPNLLINVEEPNVKNILKKMKIGKVLDVACGTGRYSKYLSYLGHKVIGLDQSNEMLSIAKINAPKVKFIQGELNKLPFKDLAFDLTICTLALTHLKSLNKAVHEMARVTKHKGRVLISDIHPLFVTIGGQAEFKTSNGNLGYINNYVHLHSEYLNTFEQTGLMVEKCIEIPLDESCLKPKQLDLNISNETLNLALANLPIVLIWVLKKK
jgi:SAM-dependent methyltransferase